MNKFELYMAINEIDEHLVAEANDTDNITTGVFLHKKTFSLTVKAVAVLTVIICAVICYNGTASLQSKNPTTPLSESTCYTIPKDSETTETSLYINDTTTTTKDAPTDKNATDIYVYELTTDEIREEKESTTLNNLPDYSLYTLTMWLNKPDVVWGENEIKGGVAVFEKTPMGTVKITDNLKEIFIRNDKTTIYAVLVDFSSCIDEDEIDNWKLNGISISELRSEFKNSIENETSENKDKIIMEYKTHIQEIKTAYYKMKIESFKDTFNSIGLKIYTDEKGAYISSYYFYTFASESQIRELTCKSTEAFVLAPAAKLK